MTSPRFEQVRSPLTTPSRHLSPSRLARFARAVTEGPRKFLLAALLTTGCDPAQIQIGSGPVPPEPIGDTAPGDTGDVGDTGGDTSVPLDSDGDGTPDDGDTDDDNDGLSDYDEVTVFGSDPLSADTDIDGIRDWEEAFPGGTDVNNPDTFGEGYGDLYYDLDADGLLSTYEVELGSNPDDPDTDSDGFKDGDEVQYGTSPTDASSHPA